MDIDSASFLALIYVLKHFDLERETGFEAACKEYKRLLAKAKELMGED